MRKQNVGLRSSHARDEQNMRQGVRPVQSMHHPHTKRTIHTHPIRLSKTPQLRALALNAISGYQSMPLCLVDISSAKKQTVLPLPFVLRN